MSGEWRLNCLHEPYQREAASGKSTPQPSFRGDAQHRARNPSTRNTRGEMDSGFATSSRPGMTREVYQTLRCPTGETPQMSVNAPRRKYSALPKFGNGVCVAATRPMEEGRIAIVTNAGRAAVDADGVGANGLAGRATVSETQRAHDRCDRRTAKSCGPGARGLCAKSCGDVAARPGSHRQSSARRRGQ